MGSRSFPRDVESINISRLRREKQNGKCFWVGRRELNPHWPQSQCGALPIELRPTQKGDKESSVTRHLADVVTFSIRPELAGMTRLELANQLIENQSAFHFAFIPVIVWCAWRDSNSSQSWS